MCEKGYMCVCACVCVRACVCVNACVRACKYVNKGWHGHSSVNIRKVTLLKEKMK